MPENTTSERVYPVGHLQGFVEVLPKSGNYYRKLAVRNGSSIRHVPTALTESFIEVVHKTPTVAEYDEWAKTNGVDNDCDLSDLVKYRIAIIGLDDVVRNPLMFKFRPTGETVTSTDGAAYQVPSAHDLSGLTVQEPAFWFWIESFDAYCVHEAIEVVASRLDWTFNDAQTAIIEDLGHMLQAGSGRLEYLNLRSQGDNWFFAG